MIDNRYLNFFIFNQAVIRINSINNLLRIIQNIIKHKKQVKKKKKDKNLRNVKELIKFLKKSLNEENYKDVKLNYCIWRFLKMVKATITTRQNVHYRSEKKRKKKWKGLDVCDKATIKPVIVRDNLWEYRKTAWIYRLKSVFNIWREREWSLISYIFSLISCFNIFTFHCKFIFSRIH